MKISDRMTRGIPDILAIINGNSTLWTLLLEVKTESGKVSAIQEHTLARLQSISAGCLNGVLIAQVVRSVDDIDTIMDGIK